MTAPWTVPPRCRPLRRRRASGWHIRASRRSGGGAGSQGGAPSGALRRRRTRAGGRPPVGSGSRHGPNRLHRFQKYRGRAGRGAAEAAVPAVISSPAHCGAPGSWMFARKSPDRAGAAAGERSGRGPAATSDLSMDIIPQYLPPAHPFSIKCADSAPGSCPGASCAAAAERRDFRLWPLRIDAGDVTGRRVQCVCRCHRTSACARSGKVRLGQDSSSYLSLIHI